MAGKKSGSVKMPKVSKPAPLGTTAPNSLGTKPPKSSKPAKKSAGYSYPGVHQQTHATDE